MAETSGLLNRRGGITPTEGSNPSVSANFQFMLVKQRLTKIRLRGQRKLVHILVHKSP